ncbi:hypothetical protein [Anaeromassilibacillus senegalensis]|uniref:hypothetical protein n=1 Tax=Anaeromassilibacillus senegalensis TaxID=1673717 RepID=UPI0006831D55|nr:hypothetical protein [Anaeromassilibacillus senegalensis]
MSKRDVKLDRYGIGKYAYRELHNFCLQYQEKKRDIPRASGEWKEKLIHDCELIEQTAVEVSDRDYQCIILHVTQDIPWHNLRLVHGLMTYERGFREERRRFYHALAQKKKIIE